MKLWRYSITALASTALLACERSPEREAPAKPAVKPSAVVPSLPVAEPPMNREELLLAALRAASAAAAGKQDKDAQRLLDGKRFALRLRFGCGTDDEVGGSRSWTFEPKRGVLRVHVAIDVSADTPLLSRLGMGQVEAAEGFWITRPWLLTPDCPVQTSAPLAPSEEPTTGSSPTPAALQPSANPRLAIVQFFNPSDSRTHRQERAYEVTTSLPVAAAPGPQGLDLVVTGRLKKTDGHPVIACVSEADNQAPSCVISAQFDGVSIEQPATGQTIADWAGG